MARCGLLNQLEEFSMDTIAAWPFRRDRHAFVAVDLPGQGCDVPWGNNRSCSTALALVVEQFAFVLPQPAQTFDEQVDVDNRGIEVPLQGEPRAALRPHDDLHYGWLGIAVVGHPRCRGSHTPSLG